jgi:hypothetical protein
MCAVRAKPWLTKPVLFVFMSDEKKELPLGNDLLKNASLRRGYQAAPEGILQDKWHESGRGGHDVGFERALADWIIKQRSHWRKSRKPETQPNRLSRF